MSVLTDLIYGGSHAVAGLTEGAVNDAIAKHGADKAIAFPDTAYFFPTIYAATGVKVKTLGDLPACVGVLKSLKLGCLLVHLLADDSSGSSAYGCSDGRSDGRALAVTDGGADSGSDDGSGS